METRDRPVLTAEDIIDVLSATNPRAYLSERGEGLYIIDGEFDLITSAKKLCEKLRKPPV